MGSKKLREQSREWFLKTGMDRKFYTYFVRPNILRIKGNKCENCGATKNLDLHHTSYIIQTIYTIKVLCRKCHMIEDGRFKK